MAIQGQARYLRQAQLQRFVNIDFLPEFENLGESIKIEACNYASDGPYNLASDMQHNLCPAQRMLNIIRTEYSKRIRTTTA